MKTTVMAGVGAIVLLVAAVLVGTALSGDEVGAQEAGGYEYGYLVGVPRLESYEIDVSRWAGSADDKKYLETHVFVYEQGQTNFDRQINSLRKLNELSGQGWELYDAEAGVVRRKR
ncbi:MAG: hypothetical protein H6841_08400 [Planctomycetes bacterium]|nr:hypothetical protein [Planctomycetota bacterium]MCB9934780.1 hypothetical protein [Planctomycetota bacterium]